MKQRNLFLALLLSFFTVLCNGLQLPVESNIVEVSLFRDGALVTRQGIVDVPEGKSTLILSDLPSDVDTTTLQAHLFNNNGGFIRNIKIYQPESTEQKEIVKNIQKKLISAEKDEEMKLRIITDAKENISFARNMQKNFSNEFGKYKDGESLSLEKAKELSNFVSEILATSHKQIDSAKAELVEIKETKEVAKKELHDVEEQAEMLMSVAEVEIEMEEAGKASISLTYLVNSAQWEPRYEVWAYPDEGHLDIIYIASITQRTGEDWSNVTLFLQTNRAKSNGNVPELHPMHIRKVYDGDAYSGYYKSSEENYHPEGRRSIKRFDGYMNIKEEMISTVDSVEPTSSITESTVSFEVRLPGKVIVLSRPESSAYKILEKSVKAMYWSETVPHLELRSYLQTKIRNTLDLPILPGNAVSFVDGKLSSKVHLRNVQPNEDVKISLGVNDNIVVKRTKGTLKDSDSGYHIIGPTKTLSREYVNAVTNLHKVDHKIIVVDRFPIARDGKIEIYRKEPLEDSVNFEDKNNGIFLWNATLAPKERKIFTTTFEVVHPREWKLSVNV